MNSKYKKHLVFFWYSLVMVLIFSVFIWLGQFSSFQKFVNTMEQGLFDFRQNIISTKKEANSEIVILAIDDATYEYIMSNYGSWPITRDVWSKMTNAIEKAKPKYLIFDMLFLMPNLKDMDGDIAFVESVKNNDNIYLSMNFDNYSDEIRKSPVLEEKLKLKIAQGNLENSEYITFINARAVMPQLSEVTENIASINIAKDNDGVIRDVMPIFKYKNDYYPSLDLMVAMDYFGNDEISIIDNKIYIDDNHFIPLNSINRATLNWYGKSKTFKHIPAWEVIKAYKNNDIGYLQEKFNNKIVYVGTTVTSLHDIKIVPTETNLAGVELHATFLNNILDQNFIQKVDSKINFLIAVMLSLFFGYVILKTSSVLKTIILFTLSLITYFIATTYLMYLYNLWVGVVIPYFVMIVTFILIYCTKYILKSKDYEQVYKLAVTDGLTQLYNHRYFQEQMIINMDNYKRYDNCFSLILIDIDFFKKFNDTYGHQSGDCVLKQVANILKKNSRVSDIACRYGGEEMSVILTNTNKEEATITANKICLAVRNNKFILANNEKVNVTISVGVATSGINGETPQKMIEFADKCLYKAKESGRNQVVSEID